MKDVVYKWSAPLVKAEADDPEEKSEKLLSADSCRTLQLVMSKLQAAIVEKVLSSGCGERGHEFLKIEGLDLDSDKGGKNDVPKGDNKDKDTKEKCDKGDKGDKNSVKITCRGAMDEKSVCLYFAGTVTTTEVPGSHCVGAALGVPLYVTSDAESFARAPEFLYPAWLIQRTTKAEDATMRLVEQGITVEVTIGDNKQSFNFRLPSLLLKPGVVGKGAESGAVTLTRSCTKAELEVVAEQSAKGIKPVARGPGKRALPLPFKIEIASNM
jgi:hypothetical protein